MARYGEVVILNSTNLRDWDELQAMLLNWGTRLETARANSQMRTAYHRRAKKRGRK